MKTAEAFAAADRPLRIVQIAPDYYPVPPLRYGGIERMVYSLTEELVKLGHEVFLYAPEGSRTSAVHIPYKHMDPDANEIARFVLRTLPANIDLIHDHTHKSVVGRSEQPIPAVCTIHDSVRNPVAHPVYLSRRALESAGGGSGYFIYNGIDPEMYPVAERKDDYLLFLGVLSPHKGILHALDVAEAAGMRLVIAGPVFSEEYFRKEVQPRLAENPKLEYIGEVGGEQRLRLLQQARCLLFPTSWEEPFGLVMAEAMACGTPVVALERGAVAEVLEGFPELIAESVEDMCRIVRAGVFPDAHSLRRYVCARFTAGGMAKQYLALYRRVLAESSRRMETVSSKVSAEHFLTPPQLYGYGNACKMAGDLAKAEDMYERILAGEADAGLKIAVCEQAADLFYRAGDREKERDYCFRSFEYGLPRAELCCRLGYLFLQGNELAKAIYWYRTAAELERPEMPGELYYEACWTWLPHLQLCICYYRNGDYEAAYRHNELAGAYRPNDEHVLHNRSLLHSRLRERLPGGGLPGVKVSLKTAGGSMFHMMLEPPGFLEETILRDRAWEPKLIEALCGYMRTNSLFLDIGANIGYHALYAASRCPGVRCLAFEPHPDVYRQLMRSVNENGLANVMAYPLAVGAVSGLTRFYMQTAESYNRGMSGIDLYPGLGSGYERIEVEMAALDSFLRNEDKANISVVKIDTQGHEYQVLRGASEMLRRSRPVVSFEYHRHSGYKLEQLLELLPDYQVYKIQPWSGEARTLEESDPDQFLQDYLCVPRELQELRSER
jgi:FkbM family methyltransferase